MRGVFNSLFQLVVEVPPPADFWTSDPLLVSLALVEERDSVFPYWIVVAMATDLALLSRLSAAEFAPSEAAEWTVGHRVVDRNQLECIWASASSHRVGIDALKGHAPAEMLSSLSVISDRLPVSTDANSSGLCSFDPAEMVVRGRFDLFNDDHVRQLRTLMDQLQMAPNDQMSPDLTWGVSNRWAFQCMDPARPDV